MVTMIGGLAVVNYDRIDLADPSAAARCPTGAIRWVEGAQRFEVELTAAGSLTG